MDSRARAAIDLYDELVTERSSLTTTWREIARRIAPEYDRFYRGVGNPERGSDSTAIFDLTGAVANERFASAFAKMTADSSRIWHFLTLDDEDLSEQADVKQWLDLANRILFRERYAPQSNFATQYLENCKALGAFGVMGTMIEDVPGRAIRYSPIDLATTYLTTDAWGRVNGLARCLEYNAPQLAERFGLDVLPTRVRAAAQSPSAGTRNQKYEVIHTIQPSGERWPVQSVYALREDGALLSIGGFRQLPAAVARFSTMPGEKYGRSPSMLVLPSLKMLNEMKKTFLRGMHKLVDPPLLAHDDGVLATINTGPGKVTMGALTEQGKPLLQPLQTGGRMDWAQMALEDERKPINAVYLQDMWLTFAEKSTQTTAREVVERAAEKAALMGPATERVQSEYHGPLIRRELAIHVEAGRLPPMPEPLAEYLAEREIAIRYEGEMSRAQRADDAGAILRLAEVAPAISAFSQTAVKRVKWDEAFGELAELLGVQQSLIRTEDEMAEEAEADAAMEQAALLAQGVPAAAAAAKDFAAAEATRAQTSAATASPAGALF